MAPIPKIFKLHLQKKTLKTTATTIFDKQIPKLVAQHRHCFIALTGSMGQECIEGWLAPALQHLGFPAGAGIICQPVQINPEMTQNLAFVGPMTWSTHMWPLQVAWVSHSMAFGF